MPCRQFIAIAALCGAFGVASGYAIFLYYPQIREDPISFVFSLGVAAVVSYLIEWLRELIRSGEIESHGHSTLRSIGTLGIVLFFELFVSAYHASAERGPKDISQAAMDLLGPDSQDKAVASYTVFFVAGCWVVVGAMLSVWLARQVGRGHGSVTIPRVVSAGGSGAIGGFLIAPAVILLYILCGRLVLTFYVFIKGATLDARRAPWSWTDLHSRGQRFGEDLLNFVASLPIILLSEAARGDEHPHLYWAAFIGLLFFWVWLVRRKLLGNPLTFALLVGLFFSTIGAFLRAGLTVLQQIWQKRLPELGSALLLGAIVWTIPGLLLGALVPLLRVPSRSQKEWALIGYGAAALLILATLLRFLLSTTEQDYWWWPFIPALLAAIAGLLFHRGMPVREFWPLAALCVAGGISGATSIAQQVTFVGVLQNLHKIDEMQPPEWPHISTTSEPATGPKETTREVTKQVNGGMAESAEDSSKILELAVSGSVGFWITVGLLACWSLYEHDPEVENEAAE
jgi:hypothetical protein